MPALVQIDQSNDVLDVKAGGAVELASGAHLRLATVEVTASAADLNAVKGIGANGQQTERIARVALAGAADTGGGIGAWTNPETVAIVVTGIDVVVTTIATGACLIDVGAQATGLTTLSDNLADGIDIHSGSAPYTLTRVDQAGTNGKGTQYLAAAKFVTFSTQTGGSDASAGFVGIGYIHYHFAT